MAGWVASTRRTFQSGQIVNALRKAGLWCLIAASTAVPSYPSWIVEQKCGGNAGSLPLIRALAHRWIMLNVEENARAADNHC
jgi:hypothetical protein